MTHHPRYPFRINVGFLINQPIGTSREIHFEFPELHLKPELDLYQFQGIVCAAKTAQGILLRSEFKAFVEAECVRCLETFKLSLETEFDELFAFNKRSLSESGLLLPEDGNIDLASLVREYMLVEIPISPLCQPDCKGLCIECGINLNHETCEHQSKNNKDLQDLPVLAKALRSALLHNQ